MALSDYSRGGMILTFHEIRTSFLAALDQVVAEMRTKISGKPDLHSDSLVLCALAFSDTEIVRRQLDAARPGILDDLEPGHVQDAHLASLSYLLSLILHELILRDSDDPTNTIKELFS